MLAQSEVCGMPESHDGTECKLRHPQQTVEYEEEHRLNVSPENKQIYQAD